MRVLSLHRLGKVTDYKMQAMPMLVLSADMEVQVHYQQNSEFSTQVKFMKSLIKKENGLVVAATPERLHVSRYIFVLTSIF